jgi:hypothetical protein
MAVLATFAQRLDFRSTPRATMRSLAMCNVTMAEKGKSQWWPRVFLPWAREYQVAIF